MDNTFFEDYTQLLNGIDNINKTAEGFGYAYLELTPLLNNVMPKLQEHNFILVQSVQKTDGVYIRDTHDKDGAKHIETPAFVLNSKLIHKSGQEIECNMPLYVDDIDPQAIGSAETYMRRYSIYALLNIRVSDDDGLDASARAKKNRKPLPDNVDEIATFLMKEEKPSVYYGPIVELRKKKKITDDLYYKLTKIMYPK